MSTVSSEYIFWVKKIPFLSAGRALPHILHITPGVLKVRPGQDVNILCYSMLMDRRTRGPRPKLRSFDSRLPLRTDDAPDNAVSGSIIRIDPSFNGTIIECFSDVCHLPFNYFCLNHITIQTTVCYTESN